MSDAPFSLTDNAVKRLHTLISNEADTSSKLRIAVIGGGCSGFSYDMNMDTSVNDDDTLISDNDKTPLVVIDQTSLEFLQGSVLDYIETLGAAHFEIKNPNATANCGCGNSFAV